MLADGKTLVTLVVPKPLLAFSQQVMREKFTAIFQKAIYNFEFSRTHNVDRELYQKLKQAQDTRGVVVSIPGSIKAFMLKLVEIMHTLDVSTNLQAEIDTREANSGLLGSVQKLLGLHKQTVVLCQGHF